MTPDALPTGHSSTAAGRATRRDRTGRRQPEGFTTLFISCRLGVLAFRLRMQCMVAWRAVPREKAAGCLPWCLVRSCSGTGRRRLFRGGREPGTRAVPVRAPAAYYYYRAAGHAPGRGQRRIRNDTWGGAWAARVGGRVSLLPQLRHVCAARVGHRLALAASGKDRRHASLPTCTTQL